MTEEIFMCPLVMKVEVDEETSIATMQREEEECSDVQQLCRMCGEQCSRMSSSLLHNNPTLVCKLNFYFNIQVKKDDNMPSSICNICTLEIEHWETVKSNIQHAQVILIEKVKKLKENAIPCAVISIENEDQNNSVAILNNEIQPSQKVSTNSNCIYIEEDDTSSDVQPKSEILEEYREDSNNDPLNFVTSDLLSSETYKKSLEINKNSNKVRKFPIRSHSPNNPFLCGECPKKFKFHTEFENHVKIHRQKDKIRSHFCAHCNVRFRVTKALIDHQKDHIINPDAKICYSCEICSQEYAKVGDFNRHIKMHSKKENKEKIDVKKTDDIKTVKEPVKQPIALPITPKDSNIPIEYATLIPLNSINLELLQSSISSIPVIENNSIGSISNASIIPMNSDLILAQNNVTLAQNNVTLAQNNVTLAQNNVTPVKNISIQDISNKSKIPIYSNQNFVPYNGNLIPCGVCNEKYVNFTLFQNHLYKNTSHDKKLFKCLYCGVFCNNKIKYLKHINIHIKEKQGIYVNNVLQKEKIRKKYNNYKVVCTICGKLITKMGMKVHMEAVHSNNVRKYVCNICNTSYKSLSTLICHKRVHDLNRKVYKCSLCDKEYHSKSNMKLHILSHLNYRPYKCNFCDNKYYCSPAQLNDHMRTIHVQKLHKCIKCSKEFKDMGKCRRHMKMVCNVPREDIPYKILV